MEELNDVKDILRNHKGLTKKQITNHPITYIMQKVEDEFKKYYFNDVR